MSFFVHPNKLTIFQKIGITPRYYSLLKLFATSFKGTNAYINISLFRVILTFTDGFTPCCRQTYPTNARWFREFDSLGKIPLFHCPKDLLMVLRIDKLGFKWTGKCNVFCQLLKNEPCVEVRFECLHLFCLKYHNSC